MLKLKRKRWKHDDDDLNPVARALTLTSILEWKSDLCMCIQFSEVIKNDEHSYLSSLIYFSCL